MKKILNVVYDTFDSLGEPVPNLTNQYSKRRLADSRNLIKHYIDDTSYSDKFGQKTCTMSEVIENPNQNYYYFINHAGEFLFDFFESEIFTEQVKEFLHKYPNFRVVFLTEHEPDNEFGFVALNDYLKFNNINGKQIYVVNNNHMLNDYKIKHNSNINVHTIRFVPHSSTKVLRNVGGCNFEPEKTGKFFQLFNKSPKLHRYALLCLLMKENLLDKINWSLVPGYNCFPRDSYYDLIFTLREQKELKNEIDYFYNLKFKASDFEEKKGWFNEFSEVNTEGFPVWMFTPEYPRNYENTYINIVTESMFLDKNNNIHISEKTFKPFFYYQMPLILSTHHHIKMVKEKYGFDFFDDIIDHSYDNEPNQRKRLEMFVNEIKRIDQNRDEIINFYKNNKNRFASNKQKVLNVLDVVDEDFKFFEGLI